MKRRIAVLGKGSGGIQSLCYMLSNLDNTWEVVSVSNPNIPIVGIGESTNPTFTNALEMGASFTFYNDLDSVDGTLKLGTKFVNWREQDFVNPIITGSVAMHFNTYKLEQFVMPRIKEMWGDKFKTIYGNVDALDGAADKVTVTIDGAKHDFDYVIDCRGFPKDYTDYHVIEEWPLNRCLVHDIQGKYESSNESSNLYTIHRATQDGWMFEIPLQSRYSTGYLFNDNITDVDTAKKNYAELLGIPVEQLEPREFRFKSYYAKSLIKDRIIKNGNSAFFLEPMFANSLWVYNQADMLAIQHINGLSEDECNTKFLDRAKQIEEMIYFHYQGGSNIDSTFWQKASALGKEKTTNGFNLKRTIENVSKMKQRGLHDYSESSRWVFGLMNVIRISNNLGYDYFDKKIK